MNRLDVNTRRMRAAKDSSHGPSQNGSLRRDP